MNRLVSVGLAIAVAPAILLGVAQLMGSPDLVMVSSEALFVVALPLGGLLVLAGILGRPAKRAWDNVSPAVGEAVVAAADSEAPPSLPPETTWTLIVRALRRIPWWLVAAVLVALAFFLPTGLERPEPSASPPASVADMQARNEQRRVYREMTEIIGGNWAGAGLAIIAFVTLLFAARAGRWEPELRGWGYTVTAWITVAASGFLIALALGAYLPSGLTDGWGLLLYLMIGAANVAIVMAAAVALSVASGDPQRTSAFRAGACAFAWTSLLYFMAAFRFIESL